MFVQNSLERPKQRGKPSSSSFFPFGAALKVGLYLYTVVMALFFLQQAVKITNKYLRKEVIEEVEEESRKTAVMPQVTICLFPGLKDPSLYGVPYLARDMRARCQENANGTDVGFKSCVDSLLFTHPDVVEDMNSIFLKDSSMKDQENFGHVSINLRLGSCFSYQFHKARMLNPAMADRMVFSMEEASTMASGWTVGIFFHTQGRFMPVLGVSHRYAGQKLVISNPKLNAYSLYTLDVSQRVRLNTDKHQCEEDPEYNPAACMEEYVRRTIGCSSPWDVFTEQNDKLNPLPECTSWEEGEKMVNVHTKLKFMGTSAYQELTGCLPSCEYDEFEYSSSSVELAANSALYNFSWTGVAWALLDTNKKVVKDVYLYERDQLVGELGGSLGMFLGISLISFFQTLTWACEKGMSRIGKSFNDW